MDDERTVAIAAIPCCSVRLQFREFRVRAMIVRKTDRWRPLPRAIFAGAALLPMLPAPALAQTAPPSGSSQTLSLTETEKADLLAGNTEDSVNAARAGLPSGSPVRGIHGEMGVMIGTHGSRGIYGTAAIPLGDNAGAVVSVESSRFGTGR
jgi:hypothetical protein